MSLLCPRCSQVNPDTRAACLRCGARLVDAQGEPLRPIPTPHRRQPSPFRDFLIISGVISLALAAILGVGGNLFYSLLVIYLYLGLWVAVRYIQRLTTIHALGLPRLWFYRVVFTLFSLALWPIAWLLTPPTGAKLATVRLTALTLAIIILAPLLVYEMDAFRYASITREEQQRWQSSIDQLAHYWGEPVRRCQVLASQPRLGQLATPSNQPLKLLLIDWHYPTAVMHPWQAQLPQDQRANSATDYAWLICIDELMLTQYCNFQAPIASPGDSTTAPTNPSSSGKPDFSLTYYGLQVSIIHAADGIEIARLELNGASPDACPASLVVKNGVIESIVTASGNSLPFSQFKQAGQPVTYEAFINQVNNVLQTVK